MHYKIAELTVEIPEAGGIAPRCREYLCAPESTADITIHPEHYNFEQWPGASYDLCCYLESGFQFYGNLLRFDGIMLHASAVELDGKAYLFSAPCGTGKSTHTRLWQQTFGEKAVVFNDDKPALRRIDGKWYAYGTPWCGKDDINVNKKVPLAGICFLKQATQNRIRRLSASEAVQNVIFQTMYKFTQRQLLIKMLEHVDKLVSEIPIFELENLPDQDAVQLSYSTMLRAAEELGL